MLTKKDGVWFIDYPKDRRLLERELVKILKGRHENIRKIERFLKRYPKK